MRTFFKMGGHNQWLLGSLYKKKLKKLEQNEQKILKWEEIIKRKLVGKSNFCKLQLGAESK